MKKYGVGVVVGIIDEDGMVRIVDKKFEIVKWVYDVVIEYGILVCELFFDILVLLIFIGIEEDRENGKVIIEVIKCIWEELLGFYIMFGVFNVLFGLNFAVR